MGLHHAATVQMLKLHKVRLFSRIPREYPHHLIFFRNYNHRPTLCRWQYRSIFVYNFYGGLHKTILLCKSEWRFDRSRSSKVIDFGANWKRACDFLSVCDSNLGHYLAPFRSYGTFYVLLAPSQFHPNFGGVPVGTDSPCWVSLSRALSY